MFPEQTIINVKHFKQKFLHQPKAYYTLKKHAIQIIPHTYPEAYYALRKHVI